MTTRCMIFYILTLNLIFLSCEKSIECPDLEGDCLSDTTAQLGKLDTIWTKKIKPDIGTVISNNLFHYKNYIIHVWDANGRAFVSNYHYQSGNLEWQWEAENERYFPSSSKYENTLLLQNEWDIYSVNLNAGILENHFKEENYNDAHSFGQVLGDHYYFAIRKSDDSKAWVIRSKVNSLQQWDTIYSLERNQDIGDQRPNIQSYNLWINPNNGDSILIFQHRMPSRVDIVAWNMDQQEVVWRHDDITPNGNSNHQQIFIHDNKAYFGGSVSFFCFDMNNGDIVWRYDDNSGHTPFMIYNSIYAESIDAIIVSGSGDLLAFDTETGVLKWRSNFDGSISSGSPVYHNGIIYRTGRGLLYAYRASNGELLWSENSSGIPFGPKTFQGELAIDRERGILYATSSDKLFAIRVYED